MIIQPSMHFYSISFLLKFDSQKNFLFIFRFFLGIIFANRLFVFDYLINRIYVAAYFLICRSVNDHPAVYALFFDFVHFKFLLPFFSENVTLIFALNSS